MSTDDFERVARVANHSRIASAGRSAIERLRLAASRAYVVAAWRNARARIKALAAAERVRLAGVLILTATITQAVLLQWTPSIVRPAAPALLRFEAVAAALVMIVLAEAIARAWTGSHLRRLVSRVSASSHTARDAS